MKKRKWTKVALALSACLFVVWWMLGAGATLAWFSDTDEARNEFDIGLLQLDVDYRNDNMSDYEDLEGATDAFDDQALYEPGYTQVVYLRVDNIGDMDFTYKMAVTVNNVEPAVSVLGNTIHLPDYLRYGVVFGETEADVQQQVKDRLTARDNAPEDWGRLDTWSEPSPYVFEAEDDYHYAALIVWMPEDVDNVANYRGDTAPIVELGISVSAQQLQ